MKRPVRIRMQGVVGAGGEKPQATRLAAVVSMVIYARHMLLRNHLGLYLFVYK